MEEEKDGFRECVKIIIVVDYEEKMFYVHYVSNDARQTGNGVENCKKERT